MAVYLATRQVRHLAAWTANDRVPADADARHARTGTFRPICGTAVHDSALLIGSHDLSAEAEALFDPAWVRQLRAARRRPVCKACAAQLHSLLGLAEVAW